MIKYRTEGWDKDFNSYVNMLKTKKNVIICGDLRVSREKMDVFYSPPKDTVGFRPKER